MSIEKFYGHYTAVCDNCGKYICAESWDDARKAKKDAGWESRKVNGEWTDICDDCLFYEKGYK